MVFDGYLKCIEIISSRRIHDPYYVRTCLSTAVLNHGYSFSLHIKLPISLILSHSVKYFYTKDILIIFRHRISGAFYSDVFRPEYYQYSDNIPTEYRGISPNINDIPNRIPGYKARNIRLFRSIYFQTHTVPFT